MIIPTLLTAAISLAPTSDLSCPIMGSKITAKATEFDDYAGVRYTYCCAGCSATFKKDPKSAITKMVSNGKVVGAALHDPITHNRIQANEAKSSSDYKGVRYYFSKTTDKGKFDKAPATYSKVPAKVSLTCPVSHEEIGGYANAFTYRDIGGVRYYICCNSCAPKFDLSPSKYTAGIKSSIKSHGFFNPVAGQHQEGGDD